MLKIAKHGRIINEHHNAFITEYMEGIELAVKQRNCRLQVSFISRVPIEEIVESQQNNPADGLIVLGTEMDAHELSFFSALPQPIVFIDTYFPLAIYDCIDMDNTNGVFKAVQHLYANGHRSIGLVKSSLETRNFKVREAGFREVMDYFSLPVQERYFISVDPTFDQSVLDINKFLNKTTALPTAFFCMNDIIAYGSMKALRGHHIRIPEDVSIIGFDDLPASSFTDPPLTTIRVSTRQIGMRALERLVRRIAGHTADQPENILISGKLMSRSSVKKYREVHMKVLVFGSLNIDLIFFVDHIVRPGETISSTSLVRSAGGKGANQAAALGKAGLPVSMAGKIGQDGRFLLTLLRSYGVDTGRVMLYEGATGQALIQLDKNKQNSIVLFSGGNGAIVPEEIDPALDGFGPGDCIVLQNEIVRLREIMERAHKRKIRIYLNPSPYNEIIGTLPLDLADTFFVNEIEGALLAALPPDSPPAAALDALTSRFPRSEIILTAGRDGAYYGCGAAREREDIIDLPVADTTGAGDTFTGYFIAARSRNFSMKDSLAIACKAASIAVSRPGAMQSIPVAGEVF